ncbi:MAG: NAD(P)-dependent glycerol-3-phosphate dehydrogenase [Thermomicrobiales bacterium]|nr:NAD(P)-dependent glycerol-3-phosphate dehydrogenase [Thermomicrobiales bacterium]
MARERIAVIGAGAWGTGLAVVATRAGNEVALYVRRPEAAAELAETRRNDRYLPGARIPDTVRVTADLEEACRDAALILLVVPSQTMRENAAAIAPYVGDAVVVSAAKGLDRATLERMTVVAARELPAAAAARICALSGPNLAAEIVAGKPATTVVAGREIAAAERARDLLMSPLFRVYTNEDVVGVEIAGALKNIMGIGAGIADGLEAGDNAKAAFITRGIAEIARLGFTLGAHPLTFAGLAGLGDLVATCASPLSRNRYVGQELAKGRPLAEIRAGMANVAEGIFTTEAAVALGRRAGVELPIAEQIYAVLFEDKPVSAAIAGLMQREAKDELEEVRRMGFRV